MVKNQLVPETTASCQHHDRRSIYPVVGLTKTSGGRVIEASQREHGGAVVHCLVIWMPQYERELVVTHSKS